MRGVYIRRSRKSLHGAGEGGGGVTDNVCLVINVFHRVRGDLPRVGTVPFGKPIATCDSQGIEGSRPPVSPLDQPMRIEIYDSKLTVNSGVANTKMSPN